MRTTFSTILLFLLVLLLCGCGAMRPVLYPNEQLKSIGKEKANQEIDACIRLAEESQAGGSRSGQIAKDTAKSGAIGAATGAVIGAITGDFRRAAAIGGAGSATAAAGSGILRSDEPDPLFRQFVDHCLREKGLQPIGWR